MRHPSNHLAIPDISRILGASLVLLGLVLAQQFMTLGGSSRLAIAFNNAAHIPWFFTLTLLLWGLCGYQSRFSFRSRVLLCVILCLCLATGLEAMQLLSERDADVRDVALNWMGAGAALCIIFAHRYWTAMQRLRSFFYCLLAASVFLTGFSTVIQEAWLQHKKASNAPSLISFEQSDYIISASLRANWDLQQADGNWPEFSNRPVARIRLNPQERWPGIILLEPIRNWNGYDYLSMQAFLPAKEPMTLLVRLETFADRGLETTLSIQLLPGPNNIHIPIREIAGSRFGTLDNVRNLFIFKEAPREPEFFLLGSLVLERAGS